MDGFFFSQKVQFQEKQIAMSVPLTEWTCLLKCTISSLDIFQAMKRTAGQEEEMFISKGFP